MDQEVHIWVLVVIDIKTEHHDFLKKSLCAWNKWCQGNASSQLLWSKQGILSVEVLWQPLPNDLHLPLCGDASSWHPSFKSLSKSAEYWSNLQQIPNCDYLYVKRFMAERDLRDCSYTSLPGWLVFMIRLKSQALCNTTFSRREASAHSPSYLFFFFSPFSTNFNCCPYALLITPTIHTTPAGPPAHIRQIRDAHNSSRLLMMFMWSKFLLTVCKCLKEDNWAPDTFGCTVKRFLLLHFLKCAYKATGAKWHWIVFTNRLLSATFLLPCLVSEGYMVT